MLLYSGASLRPLPRIHTKDIVHPTRRPTQAGVNFSPALKDPGHAAFSHQWRKAVARVIAHDMPPAAREAQPTDEERQMFSEWLAKVKYLSPEDPDVHWDSNDNGMMWLVSQAGVGSESNRSAQSQPD